MKDVYNSGYSNYVLYTYYGIPSIILYPSNAEFTLLEHNNKIFGGFDNFFDDFYVFHFIDSKNSTLYQKYFPNDISGGWEYSTRSDLTTYYGCYDGVISNGSVSFYYITDGVSKIIEFMKDGIIDSALDFPLPGDITGDTTEDKPYIVNPEDVITHMPEKIANDDVISIPDGTTIEDIAVPLPGDLVSDPALPGVGTPTLVGGIVGDLVPVDNIDFPWENVANPDLPVDPSVPANPDYELDPKDYQIKPIIIEKFPFCIPWDVVKCVSLLGQTPEVPKFEYRFYIKSLKIDETFVIDLKDFEPVANVSRWFFRILFIFGLAVATRNLIRG